MSAPTFDQVVKFDPDFHNNDTVGDGVERHRRGLPKLTLEPGTLVNKMERLILILLATLALRATAEPLKSTVTVSALSDNKMSILKETSDVRCLRFKSLLEEPRVYVGMGLGEGDLLESKVDGVMVEVKCLNGSRLRFSEGFKAVVTDTKRDDCAVDLTEGRINVLTDQNTAVNAGGLTLGSEGTEYEIFIGRSAKNQRIFVFDGKVAVNSENQKATILRAGRSLRAEKSLNEFTESRILVGELLATAYLYTRFDISKSDKFFENAEEAFRLLEKRHQEVLLDPEDKAKLLALADTQEEYRIYDEAEYSRRRASKAVKRDTRPRRPRPPSAPPPSTPPPPSNQLEIALTNMPSACRGHLEQLAGQWIINMRVWSTPGTEPTEASGRLDARWILDGRFLETRHTSEIRGEPYESLQIDGFDYVKEKCVSYLFDNKRTAPMVFRGSCSVGRTACGLSVSRNLEAGPMGEFPFLLDAPDYYAIKKLTQVADDSSYRVNYYLVSSEKERLVWEIVARRADKGELVQPKQQRSSGKVPLPEPPRIRFQNNLSRKIDTSSSCHGHLRHLVGQWMTDMGVWSTPGTEPTEASGRLDARWILDGRFLETRHTSEIRGERYESLQIDGFDHVEEKCVSYLFDSKRTVFMVFRGLCNLDGTACDLSISRKPEAGPMEKFPFLLNAPDYYAIKKLTQVVDDSNYMVNYYLGSSGKDRLVWKIFARRK